MSAPLALDLFCGAGGASMGLRRAGFEVVGIDIMPQPRYPFRFIRADALRPPVRLEDFALVWASPPCQAYCTGRLVDRDYPRCVEATRELLSGHGASVIENVWGAPLRRDLILDGTMFPELRVIRRRVFELSDHFRCGFFLAPTSRVRPNLVARYGYATVVGGGRCSGTPKAANIWHTDAAKRAAMGIDWMTRAELAQAVPPAYAEFIGRAAIAALERRAA